MLRAVDGAPAASENIRLVKSKLTTVMEKLMPKDEKKRTENQTNESETVNK